jgi:protein tyrosine phosphatase
MIATDICMKAFEDNKAADILNTVFKLRQDRAGAVQTKEQYAFIYKVMR